MGNAYLDTVVTFVAAAPAGTLSVWSPTDGGNAEDALDRVLRAELQAGLGAKRGVG